MTVDELEAALVVAFPESQTRADIFAKWRVFRDGISKYISVSAEYVDGSFVTGRNDPHDIDLSIWVQADEFNALPVLHQMALNSHFQTGKLLLGCDAYLVPECAPGHPDYSAFQFMQWTRGHWSKYSDPSKTIVPGVTKGYLRVVQ